ncbi:hypothetical protein FRZ61_17950 [Hypericibacter adhaerens]|uniref:Uncharacterized protein n=1 Tax=Hypericibacter adhaerens TaxID=2602016 RepID=A0A5J6N4M6_9PROT|nr:hypothetical protein FRZ61_17950 [Hypericibacter adhaerens]
MAATETSVSQPARSMCRALCWDVATLPAGGALSISVAEAAEGFDIDRRLLSVRRHSLLTPT